MYEIREVDGEQHADEIHRFNSFAPKTFPSLATSHLTDGHWWFVYHGGEAVAFAGLVTFEPFPPNYILDVLFRRAVLRWSVTGWQQPKLSLWTALCGVNLMLTARPNQAEA